MTGDSKQARESSNGLSLAVAGYKFKRTEALFEGRIKIEGCDAHFKEMGIGDINTHVFSGPLTFGAALATPMAVMATQ